MAEWLRRLTRNQMGYSRTGSNPVHDELLCEPEEKRLDISSYFLWLKILVTGNIKIITMREPNGFYLQLCLAYGLQEETRTETCSDP